MEWRRGRTVRTRVRKSSGGLKFGARAWAGRTFGLDGRIDRRRTHACRRARLLGWWNGHSLGRFGRVRANIVADPPQSRSPAVRTLPRRASRRPWSSPPRPSLVPRPRLPRSPTPRPSSRSAAPSTSTPSSSTTPRRLRSLSSRFPLDSRSRSSRPRSPPRRSNSFGFDQLRRAY